MCCSSWGYKESDMTERLKWVNIGLHNSQVSCKGMSRGRCSSIVSAVVHNASKDQIVPSFCTDIIRLLLFFHVCTFSLLALLPLLSKTIFKDKRQSEGTVPAMLMWGREYHQMPQQTFPQASLAVTRTHGPLLLQGKLKKRVLSFLRWQKKG